MNEENISGAREIHLSKLFLNLAFINWIQEVIGFVFLNTCAETKKTFREKTNLWFESLKLPIFDFIMDTKKMIYELERNDFIAFETVVKS